MFIYRDIHDIDLSVFLISTEGKGDVEKVQERAGRIQQLMDALREETLNPAATEQSDLRQQVMLYLLNMLYACISKWILY